MMPFGAILRIEAHKPYPDISGADSRLVTQYTNSSMVGIEGSQLITTKI